MYSSIFNAKLKFNSTFLHEGYNKILDKLKSNFWVFYLSIFLFIRDNFNVTSIYFNDNLPKIFFISCKIIPKLFLFLTFLYFFQFLFLTGHGMYTRMNVDRDEMVGGSNEWKFRALFFSLPATTLVSLAKFEATREKSLINF